LLTKIYPTGEEHWKMINAFRMMRAKNPNQQRYSTKITSRVYENLKKEYSALQSTRVSGENNPMYGTIWINNGIINKKIRGEVPEGWVRGRLISNEHASKFTKRSRVG
jgi:hypothetical protein